MINLSEQLYISLGLPMDGRLANLTLNGSNIIVESSEEYLNRVDQNSRYLNMPISFFSPSGIYDINNFVTLVNDGTIISNKYSFQNGINDSNLIKWQFQQINNSVGGDEQSKINEILTALRELRN